MSKILGQISHAFDHSGQGSASDLHIQVLEAKNLKNTDAFSKSDPYCILSVLHKGSHHGGHDHKTKVIDNNLNPVWNESFTLAVTDPSSDVLKIVVKDKDMIKDDIIGSLEIPLSQLQGSKNEWFNLHPSGSGSIHLSVNSGSSGSFQQAGGYTPQYESGYSQQPQQQYGGSSQQQYGGQPQQQYGQQSSYSQQSGSGSQQYGGQSQQSHQSNIQPPAGYPSGQSSQQYGGSSQQYGGSGSSQQQYGGQSQQYGGSGSSQQQYGGQSQQQYGGQSQQQYGGQSQQQYGGQSQQQYGGQSQQSHQSNIQPPAGYPSGY